MQLTSNELELKIVAELPGGSESIFTIRNRCRINGTPIEIWSGSPAATDGPAA